MIRNLFYFLFFLLIFPSNQFKKQFCPSAVFSAVFLSDCSSIIWTLDEADPVVLRVYIHEKSEHLLCIQQSCLNKTSQYMTEKCAIDHSSQSQFATSFFCPNIDRKLKLFSIWLQKCAIDHSNQEWFAASFFFQTLMESSRMYWIRYGQGDCLRV